MELFPALPLDTWRDTKETIHRFAQVVGKIRLAASPRRNHWWNVPFHLTGRGITTRPMGLRDGNPVFCIDFDFVAHELVISVVDGQTATFSLVDRSVADFYHTTMSTLQDFGISIYLDKPHPFDLPDSSRSFADDDEHHTYQPDLVHRYWVILSQVNLVLEEFSARYNGKISPVHHFWHSFDVAVARFSDRVIPPAPGANAVNREAYSREVISSGFWFGDDVTLPKPAFYSYTAPEPTDLADQPLRPASAGWQGDRSEHLAILLYDDARKAPDPVATVLDFFESAYEAGSRLAGWDQAALGCPGGITDPALLNKTADTGDNQSGL